MPQTLEFDKTQLPIELKIAWVFERDLDPTWLADVPVAIKNIGEKRQREYAASRKALSLISGLTAHEQLEIVAHQFLRFRPTLQVSLSHTRGLSVAVASEQVRAIGVDVEHADRRFNEKSEKFFKRAEDHPMPLLQLWSIKEAAFKALDPLGMRAPDKDILVLKDLVVGANTISLNQQVVAAWNVQVHSGLQTAIVWIS